MNVCIIEIHSLAFPRVRVKHRFWFLVWEWQPFQLRGNLEHVWNLYQINQFGFLWVRFEFSGFITFALRSMLSKQRHIKLLVNTPNEIFQVKGRVLFYKRIWKSSRSSRFFVGGCGNGWFMAFFYGNSCLYW